MCDNLNNNICVQNLSIDLDNKNIHNNSLPPTDPSLCSLENGILIFNCPHCNIPIEVALAELACKIFRHGYYIQRDSNNSELYTLLNQINPHASQSECANLASQNNIVGCCKPFCIVEKNNNYYVEICGYI